MGVTSVWQGLGYSAFLADLAPRDRDPAHIAATVIAGACVGLVASAACWILVLVPYTFLVGLGGQGLLGVGEVALMFRDSSVHDLGITLLRLVESVATDGAFPLAFVSLAAIITHRPFQHYVTVARRIRWRLLLAGLGLSFVAVLPLALAGGGPVSPVVDVAPSLAGRFVYVLAATTLMIPSAAAEELMFRGWLMRQIAAFTRRPEVLLLVTAVLFSAAHLDFAPDAFLYRVIMGAGFAYMALRTGGLELPVGAHAANNIAVLLIVAPFGPRGVGHGGPQGVWFADLALALGYVVVTEAIMRLEPLRRWSGIAPGEASPVYAPEVGVVPPNFQA